MASRLLLVWIALGGMCLPLPAELPRIILDTDYCTDVDDVGSLATLHALADQGKAEPIGIIASVNHPSAVGAIDAINTWYGRPDLPVGVADSKRRGSSRYTRTLANTKLHPSDQTNEGAPTATALYRRLLNESSDGSVKIVVVGGQTGIQNLMQSEADHEGDGIALSGKELIRQKVKELVIMGGSFTGGKHKEYNIRLDISAAQAVAKDWPSPVVYSGYEVGHKVGTGAALTDPGSNPVARAYKEYFKGRIRSRDSWDQTAVLFAIAGTSFGGKELWKLSEPVAVTFKDNAETGFKPDPESTRRYLIEVAPKEETAEVISTLMTQPPRK